jgi:hypothetical protein
VTPSTANPPLPKTPAGGPECLRLSAGREFA